MKSTGIIFDIKKMALHDGPGIRTTIFLKGCPLTCWWCHNPESQRSEPEKILKKRSSASKTPREETVGREVSVTEVIAEIEKDNIFYDESGGGVTFSGGEPLMQIEFLTQLLTYCKDHQIQTILDTCGYVDWEEMEKIKGNVDLFLYDIKIMNDELHKNYTGVSNLRILSNLEKLVSDGKNVVIRFPVIPGITDTKENIDEVVTFLSTLGSIEEINLLPYHSLGKRKYIQLKRRDLLEDLEPPTPEALDALSKKFISLGYKVKIGG
jgi:pyruvate formate lyase activating enzyme